MSHASNEQLLSPTKLANHLSCAHLTQLDLQRARGELKIEFVPDARLQAMIERGRLFEAEFVQKLCAAGLQVVTLGAGNSVDDTLSHMKAGAEVIVQAYLANDRFRGYADVLLRVPVPSQLGDWSYEVLDTKLATETKAGTILQLLTYGDMIFGLQGLAPEHFHVQTPLGRETYRTDDFGAYHRLVQARLAGGCHVRSAARHLPGAGAALRRLCLLAALRTAAPPGRPPLAGGGPGPQPPAGTRAAADRHADRAGAVPR
jgi:predicted RecB family nuclease